MRMFRAKNPYAIDLMASHIDNDDYDPGAISEMLKSMLVQTPEQLFILQLFDGEELKGFLIATNPPLQGHVFVYQAWVDEHVGGTWSMDMFARLKAWTELAGKSEIRLETKRDVDAWFKGFRLHSYILKCGVGVDVDINEGVENGIRDRRRVDNRGPGSSGVNGSSGNGGIGGRIVDESSLDLDEGTEASNAHTGSIPASEHRTGSGAIQGPDGSIASGGSSASVGDDSTVDTASGEV